MLFCKNSNSHKFLTKVVSILIIQSFLLSNIAFALPTEPSSKTTKPPEMTTNPERIVIQRDFGLVKSKFTGNSGKLVIHIQDAHCNYEAQSNIVKILENLIKNYNLTFISVEGADGVIDTSWFKAFPDEEIRKEVADYFMKKGEITGPEFLSITTDYPIQLFGAETRSYYIENLNAFTSSYPAKDETEKYYTQIKAALNKLKNFIYTDELKIIDKKIEEYETKKIQFNEYVRTLQEMAERNRINLRDYDNFFKLISALLYEKRIDFNIVDKERGSLIDELSKAISKEALAELVEMSLSFKSGKISSAEFYDYLKDLAARNGIELAKNYRNLANYIIYNSVYSKIDNEKLFKDIKSVEMAVKERLFTSDDQKTLDRLYYHVNILLGLINIKLLNGDFEYYKANKDQFAFEVFSDFIKKKSDQYGLFLEIDPPTTAVAASVPKLEDFYAIATKRDKALVDNTINQMRREKLELGVLITGGFHSEGIMKLLERQGISYMVVCPTITKDVESPYIKVLTNQRTTFEELLVESSTPPAKAPAKEGRMLAPYCITRLMDKGSAALNDLLKHATTVGSQTFADRAERDRDEYIKETARRLVAKMANIVRATSSRGVTLTLDDGEKELIAYIENWGRENKAPADKMAALIDDVKIGFALLAPVIDQIKESEVRLAIAAAVGSEELDLKQFSDIGRSVVGRQAPGSRVAKLLNCKTIRTLIDASPDRSSEVLNALGLTAPERRLIDIALFGSQGGEETAPAQVGKEAKPAQEEVPPGEMISPTLREISDDSAAVDITNATDHIFAGKSKDKDKDKKAIVPANKGGLTIEDLEQEYAAIDNVKEDVKKSYETGFLNWADRLLHCNLLEEKWREEKEKGPARFLKCEDIIVLGASPLTRALYDILGTSRARRRVKFHFLDIGNFSEINALKDRKDINWANAMVLFMSQGAGDAVHRANFEFIRSHTSVPHTNYLAIMPTKTPGITEKEASIVVMVEREGGLAIDTPNLAAMDGVAFNAEGMAAIMLLAGRYTQLKDIAKEVSDNFGKALDAERLSQTASGFLSATLRGQSSAKKDVKKFDKLGAVPFANTTVTVYGREAALLTRALIRTWNAALSARTQLDVAEMPDGQHHQFQMGLSALAHSVVNIVPDRYPDIGEDGVIPIFANSTVASRPGDKFTVGEFMEAHHAAFSKEPETGWLAKNNPTPVITVKYNSGAEESDPKIRAAASLISVFHLATIISQKVALANKDSRDGQVLVKAPEEIVRDLSKLDSEITKNTHSAAAIFAADTGNPFIDRVSGDVWMDLRGLASAIGLNRMQDKTQQQVLGRALSFQRFVLGNYIETGGKKHFFLNGPQEAGDPIKGEKYKKSREYARRVGGEGRNYYIFAVGGAHNSTVNGLEPLAYGLENKSITYMDTLDPAVIKKMCDEIRKDPEGTRLLYISNSGDTDESDAAFRIAITTLLEAGREAGVPSPVLPVDTPKYAGRLRGIMKMAISPEQYYFLHNRTFVVTGENRGRLYDEMSYTHFPMAPYPLTNGRQSIFELALITQAFVGIPEERIAEYIEAANAYIERSFILPKATGDIKAAQEKLKDKGITKEERDRLEKIVDNYKTAYKKVSEDINKLCEHLSKGSASSDEVGRAFKYLQKNPGLFAGSLIGLLNRPDRPEVTGVELEGVRSRTKLRVICLSDRLHNEWLVKNDLIESLGKPQIQFTASDDSSALALNQLVSLDGDKDSIVMLVVDNGLTGEVLATQNAVVGAMQNYLKERAIPHMVIHTETSPAAHATTTFLLQLAVIGIGGQQITAAGYPLDESHLAEVWVTKARKFARTGIWKTRAAKQEGGLERALKHAGGIEDIIEQWNLNPSAVEDDRAFVDFAEAAGKMNVSLFGLMRGWDAESVGDVRKVSDEMVRIARDSILKDSDIMHMCRNVIIVNPVTKAVENIILNDHGKYIGIFTADNPIDSAIMANSSDAVFSLFKIDDETVLSGDKDPSLQRIYANINEEGELRTNLIVQTVFKFGAYPTAFVIAPRFNRLVTYNYYTAIKDGAVEYRPKLIGATHLVAMPPDGTKNTMTVAGPLKQFPAVLREHLEERVKAGYKSRMMGGLFANAAFIAQEGGITGGVDTLLNAFLGHHIMWRFALRGGAPIYFHEGGYNDIPASIEIRAILSKTALTPVLAITGDKKVMEQMSAELETAKTGRPLQDRQPDKGLLKSPAALPQHLNIDRTRTLDNVLREAFQRNPLIDETLKEECLRLVDGVMRIACVELPSKYLDPSAEEATGSNPSAELQYYIDKIATEGIENFGRDSESIGSVITEEKDILRFELGRLILTTDPVDGIGNLEAGYPTGQFYTFSDSDTGRVLVTLTFAQGAARAIVGVGDATYAFQYILDNYKAGTAIDFGTPEKLAKGNFYYLGQMFDNVTKKSRRVFGEGGTVNEYPGINPEHAGDEFGLRNKWLVDAGAEPYNNGSVVNNVVSTVVGAHTGLNEFYGYPETLTAKPDPSKAGFGGKLRPTEELAMAGAVIAVVKPEFHEWLHGEDGNKEVERIAVNLANDLLGISSSNIGRYPKALDAMRRLAVERLVRTNGLGGVFGTTKNPFWFVPNLDDVNNVPAAAAPVFIGTPEIVKEFTESASKRYVAKNLASKQQVEREPEDWNAAEDPEWEVDARPEVYGRRAHLKANHAIGAMKLACGIWQPVIGRDNFPTAGQPYLDNFARQQERLYRELMDMPLAELADIESALGGRRSVGVPQVQSPMTLPSDTPGGRAVDKEFAKAAQGTSELEGLAPQFKGLYIGKDKFGIDTQRILIDAARNVIEDAKTAAGKARLIKIINDFKVKYREALEKHPNRPRKEFDRETHLSSVTMKVIRHSSIFNEIKNSIIVIGVSGGDCSGLNTHLSAAAQMTMVYNRLLLALPRGLRGLTEENIWKTGIPIDTEYMDRIKERGSIVTRSTRASIFKPKDGHFAPLIKAIKNLTGFNPEDIAAIDEELDRMLLDLKNADITIPETENNRGDLSILLRYVRAKKKYEPLLDALEKIRDYIKHHGGTSPVGGLIIVGGDDHAAEAYLFSTLLGDILPVNATFKSIDNDAKALMIGAKTAVRVSRERFLEACIYKGVMIMEIMGRKSPRLALETGNRVSSQTQLDRLPPELKAKYEELKDTFVTLAPGDRVTIKDFVKRIHEVYKAKGAVNVLVSEGFEFWDHKKGRDPDEELSHAPFIIELIKRSAPIRVRVAQRKNQKPDAHGNKPLAGISEFVYRIITTDLPGLRKSGITPFDAKEVKWTDLGYTARGPGCPMHLSTGRLNPEYALATKEGEMAAELTIKDETGMMPVFTELKPDEQGKPLLGEFRNPAELTEAPKAMRIFDILYVEDPKTGRITKDLERISDVYTPDQLMEMGMVLEGGRGYKVPEGERPVSPKRWIIPFARGVKLYTDMVFDAAISGFAHDRSSIITMPDDTSGIVAFKSARRRMPEELEELRKANDDLAYKIETTGPSTIILAPETQRANFFVSLNEIVDAVERTHKKEGLVTIILSKGFKIRANDPVLLEFLRARPDSLGAARVSFGLDAKTGRIAVYKDENGYAKIDFPCDLLKDILMYKLPDIFPTANHLRLSDIGNLVQVEPPKPGEVPNTLDNVPDEELARGGVLLPAERMKAVHAASLIMSNPTPPSDTPGASAVDTTYEGLTLEQARALDRLIEASRAAGDAEEIPVTLIDGREFIFMLHTGLKERIERHNAEVRKTHQGVELPLTLHIHPGRGGDKREHTLIQGHLDRRDFEALAWQDGLDKILAEHESWHIDIFNVEQMVRQGLDKARIAAALGNDTPYKRWEEWVKAGRPKGADQEFFVDSHKDADTTRIRTIFAQAESRRVEEKLLAGNPDAATVLGNIRSAHDLAAKNENVKIVAVVSGSVDQRSWEDRLSQTSPHLFNRNGSTEIISLQEKARKGNFLGTLLAYRNIRSRADADPTKENGWWRKTVMLVGMLFGRGERISPFGQIEGDRKPAIASTAARMDIGGTKQPVTAIEEALEYFAPVAVYLERRGFRGILDKWGDETEIASIDLSKLPEDGESLADNDVIKVVSVLEITDELAKQKDWVVFDEAGNMVAQLSRNKKDVLIGQLKALGIKPRADGRFYAGVSLGPVAVSYDVLDIANEVFDDEIEREKVYFDFDPYLLMALAMRGDEAKWNAAKEALKDKKDFQELLVMVPDFWVKVNRISRIFSEKYERSLNLKILNLGDKVYWADIGQHQAMRVKYMALNDRGPQGLIARTIEGIDSARDENGNIIAGDSYVSPDVTVRNSVIINATIVGSGTIEGSVIKDSKLNDVDIKDAFAVKSVRSGNTTLAPQSGIYGSIGTEDIGLKERMRHGTLLTVDGPIPMLCEEDYKEGNVEIFTLLKIVELPVSEYNAMVARNDPDARHIKVDEDPETKVIKYTYRPNYDLPILGNDISFATAYDIMLGVDTAELQRRRQEAAVTVSANLKVAREASAANNLPPTMQERYRKSKAQFARSTFGEQLVFGTSGIREVVKFLEDIKCFAIAKALASYFKGMGEPDAIALAADLRPSSPRIAQDVIAGNLAMGMSREVIYSGNVPTPAVVYYGMYKKDGAIPSAMVTASHNPVLPKPKEQNGIKPNRTTGEVLKQDERLILKHVREFLEIEFMMRESESMFDANGTRKEEGLSDGQKALIERVLELYARVNNEARDMYIERYKAFGRIFDESDEIDLIEHMAVGRDMLKTIFANLGAKINPKIRHSDWVEGFIVDTEDLQPRLVAAVEGIAAANRETGKKTKGMFTTDGDSDRPALFQEDGVFVYGDKLGYITCEYIANLNASKGKKLFAAVTATVSDAVVRRLQHIGFEVVKVKVGSPYVVKAMEDRMEVAHKSGEDIICVGFERNGGFLLGTDITLDNGAVLKALPTRDAALPTIAAFHTAKNEGRTIGELFRDRFSGEFASFGWSGLIEAGMGGNCDLYTATMGQAIMRSFSPFDLNIVEVEFNSDGSVKYLMANGETRTAAAGWTINGEDFAGRMNGIRSTLERHFNADRGFEGGIVKINYLDGVRIFFKNMQVAHMRPSGNAPQWRIYAEAATLKRAQDITELRKEVYPTMIGEYLENKKQFEGVHIVPRANAEMKKTFEGIFDQSQDSWTTWDMKFGANNEHSAQEGIVFGKEDASLTFYRTTTYDIAKDKSLAWLRKEGNTDEKLTIKRSIAWDRKGRTLACREEWSDGRKVSVTYTGDEAWLEIGKGLDKNIPMGKFQNMPFPVMSEYAKFYFKQKGIAWLDLFDVSVETEFTSEAPMWAHNFKFERENVPQQGEVPVQTTPGIYMVTSPSETAVPVPQRPANETAAKIDTNKAAASIAPQTIIAEVESMMERVSRHSILTTRESKVDYKKVVIIAKKALTQNLTGDKGALGAALTDKYRVMAQGLKKIFPNSENIVEVDTPDELVAKTNDLLGRREGLKVIILDDGTLTKGLIPEAIAAKMKGEAGTDYCLVSADREAMAARMSKLKADLPDTDLNTIIPFVNLNAMVMMGVGILDNDRVLFEAAYKTFTGEREVPPGLMSETKISWLIRALPRIGKFDINEAEELKNLKRLFDVAA